MDLKIVFLQLFSKSELKDGNKTFLEQKFSLFLGLFKKLGFTTPLTKLFNWEQLDLKGH